MARWRKAKELGVTFYDVTVKSGDKMFAPSWAILTKYKGNTDVEERELVYIEEYTQHMRESYRDNKVAWLKFLAQEDVAIACYCGSDKFCHRKLLVDIFDKVCKLHGIEFSYEGEIR